MSHHLTPTQLGGQDRWVVRTSRCLLEGGNRLIHEKKRKLNFMCEVIPRFSKPRLHNLVNSILEEVSSVLPPTLHIFLSQTGIPSSGLIKSSLSLAYINNIAFTKIHPDRVIN